MKKFFALKSHSHSGSEAIDTHDVPMEVFNDLKGICMMMTEEHPSYDILIFTNNIDETFVVISAKPPLVCARYHLKITWGNVACDENLENVPYVGIDIILNVTLISFFSFSLPVVTSLHF